MAHPMESALRRAYEAYDSGNVVGYLEACTADFSFNVSGHSRVAGSWKGRAGVQEITRRVIEISNAVFAKRSKQYSQTMHMVWYSQNIALRVMEWPEATIPLMFTGLRMANWLNAGSSHGI